MSEKIRVLLDEETVEKRCSFLMDGAFSTS